MQKVGAQHLICVSNIAFPTSIVNEAKKHGNTIRLVVFEEDIAFGEYTVPQFFNNAIQVNDRNCSGIDMVIWEIR